MRRLAWLLPLLLLAGAVGALRNQWLDLPARWNPWLPLDVREPPNLLTRYKLWRLADDRSLCDAALATSQLRYQRVADDPPSATCPLSNSLRVRGAALELSSSFLASCPLAVSYALFERHVLQPAAPGYLWPAADAGRAYRQLRLPQRLQPRERPAQPACFGQCPGHQRFPPGRREANPPGHGLGRPGRRRALPAPRADGACASFNAVLGPDYNAAHRITSTSTWAYGRSAGERARANSGKIRAFHDDCPTMTDSTAPRLHVQALSADCAEAARRWAERLGLPLAADDEAEFAVQVGEQGLQVLQLGADSPGPVRVDFVEGASAHRRKFGGGSGQMIAKAVGVQPGIRPRVLDATAGLGRDGFVLASLGCEVTLVERQPLIAALLEDGLERAGRDPDVALIAARMRLLGGNSADLMRAWDGEAPQVVYLDPMFPHRDKSALVKKEMRLFRPLVGDDLDAPALLQAALALASHRVVVKRPRKAPIIEGPKPGYSLEGKSSRYDIYPKKALGKG
ncbi:16S rRNA methyltransferase [Pseudomonas aeruginosa]|nr:16S rRNA methyltransferase [Pseudomonas aeruginosa]